MATIIERVVKYKFSYDNKCIWDKASKLKVPLPVSADGKPDYAFMDSYMQDKIKESENKIEKLRRAISN